MKRFRQSAIIVVGIVMLSIGCTDGGLAHVGTTSRALGERSPLPEVGDWDDLHAGCEGLIGDSDVLFGVARDDRAILVAFRDSEPVCADTATAIEEELRMIGQAEKARWLTGYFVEDTSDEVKFEAPSLSDNATMDPSPQPVRPVDDPSPQPVITNNTDPSPQPVTPR